MDADDQDKLEPADEPEAEDSNEQENQSENGESAVAGENAPPADSSPISAVPPRIVAETPIGGKVRPAPAPRREEIHAPTPQVEPPAADVEPQSELAEAPAVQVESPEVEAPAAESTPAEPVQEVVPPSPEPSRPPRPAVSPRVVSTSEVDAAKADDWDDDISPELAALLFQPQKRAPREENEEAAVSPAAESAPAAAESAPAAAESAPSAEPIHLTQIEEARTLPITAKGISAPSPRVQPEGKARYERIEEPLEDGQRTREQWDYRGPDYPVLSGRAVRRVVIKEVAYTDGSWHWTFERSYTDGGREMREVRANMDRTYIERIDVIKTKEAVHGEKEAMILTGPPREEKRGFLSSLLGRRGDQDDGPKAWHAASTPEAKHARKEGGRVFARKVLGLF
jgi:hypothetical protein